MNVSKPHFLSSNHLELLRHLYRHCQYLFSTSRLPSHDHHHHLRVWNYAADLLCGLSEKGNVPGKDEITLLILAVFFHDTGLIRTLDISHGKESRKFCEEFLEINPSISISDAAPALHAIEFHDIKESKPSPGTGQEDQLLTILTVSDDADAYGPVGVLRYAEIYLLRNIPIDELAVRVLNNMAHRFAFLSSVDWLPEDFFVKHRSRYRYAEGFYNSLMENTPSSGGNDSMELEIISSYMKEVFYGSSEFAEFANFLSHSPCSGKRIFGSDLISELEQYSELPGQDSSI